MKLECFVIELFDLSAYIEYVFFLILKFTREFTFKVHNALI